MSTPVVDALSRVPLLSGLDRKHLERLARDFSARTFAPGSVVLREGDTHGIGFFVVEAGEAVVTIRGEEVARIGPGSHFGANALIADRVRTATVTAETELRTWVMTIWDFRSFVQSDGAVAWKLLEELSKQVAPSHAQG